ncbi:MAG: zinc-ribbon domain-containing protein [Bacteroidales bacterium]
MIQCPNCGVDIEENANFCSLCGEPILDKTAVNPAFIKSGKLQRDEIFLTDYQRLTGYQKRKIFWTISGVILVSGIIITLFIDFIGNKTITWSKYPATVSLILFVNFTLYTFLRKKIVLMLALSFLSVTSLFILFDIYVGDTSWKIKLGIMVTLTAYLTVLVLILLVRKAKQKGLNIISYALITVGMLCICTEGIISIYTRSSVYLSWSLIVMVSVALIAILLFYIHYRLKKVTDLKRFFHI